MATVTTQRLERHERARAQGTPVVSFFVGDAPRAAQCWASLCGALGVPALETASLQSSALPAQMAATVAAAPATQARLTPWLATRTGRGAQDVAGVLRHGTTAERRLLTAQAGLDDPAADILCRILLGEAYATVTRPSGWRLPPCVAFLAHALDYDAVPALLVCPPASAERHELAREVDCAEHLLREAPRFRLALALDPGRADELLAHFDGTRQALLLREGLVSLDGDDTPGAPAGEETVARVLAAELPENARGPVLAAWREAAADEAACRRQTPQPRDGARSAVERFLFQLLTHHPATRGRFTLNSPVDTASGRLPRTEVDFLARAERLIIEVDGYYHFRGADDYRHDRLKDLVLQQEGYTVARFLARDVVERTDVVLDTVVCALEAAKKKETRQ